MTKLIDPIDCAATRGAAKQAAESHKSMLPTAEADQVTEGDELLALATSIEEQNSGVGPGYNVAILARPYIWKKVVDVLRLASTSSTRLPVGLTQELMNSTTVSCSGLDITIACNDHDTKEALMDLLVDGAFAAPPSPSQGAEREVLRRLVDVVWNEATESTAVPSTKWSDKLIDRVFPALPLAEPSDTKRGEPNFLAIALQIIHGTGAIRRERMKRPKFSG